MGFGFNKVMEKKPFMFKRKSQRLLPLGLQ